jgi:sugar lactone lactonase YvrE
MLAVVVSARTEIQAIGLDRDDLVIATHIENIFIHDSDLSVRGNLAYFNLVAGLDFDLAGRLVAVSGYQRDESVPRVRVFRRDGTEDTTLAFTNPQLGYPSDLKVGPSGNYYLGTGWEQRDAGLREFSPAGNLLRQFDDGPYRGVAVLPSNILWAGFDAHRFSRPNPFSHELIWEATDINVFDLVSGSQIGSFTLDHGQVGARSMFYSATTDTVLIADSQADAVFERRTDGTFIRSFTAPGMGDMNGVTRGPGGHVFATDFSDYGVYRWTADGTFVGFSRTGIWPMNIVWAGNFVPEPASLTLLASCFVSALLRLRVRG